MKREFSGRLLLRIDPALHGRLYSVADKRGVSINALCAGLIGDGISGKAASPWWLAECSKLVKLLQKHFADKLAGVVLFGSQVNHTSTDASDLDVLIVLDSRVRINRSLYSWWDDAIAWKGRAEASPQFVNLPKGAGEAGSIWFEVAMASEILWERGRVISSVIRKLKKFIEDDRIRRHFVSGQTYWVRRDDEEQGSRA